MSDKCCQINSHRIGFDLGMERVAVRLRVASLWSRWWMCQRDFQFGVRTTMSYGGRRGEGSSIREDVCTTDLIIRRLGLDPRRSELVRSGVGLECGVGSAKAQVLGELVVVAREEEV